MTTDKTEKEHCNSQKENLDYYLMQSNTFIFLFSPTTQLFTSCLFSDIDFLLLEVFFSTLTWIKRDDIQGVMEDEKVGRHATTFTIIMTIIKNRM